MSTGTIRWNMTTGTVMMYIIGTMTTKAYWPKLIATLIVTQKCVIATHTTLTFTTVMNIKKVDSFHESITGRVAVVFY